LVHHPKERRIGDVVVDDEPHVDRERTGRPIDRDGLDMAADGCFGVVEADLMVTPQGVGGTEAADTATDDRHAHQRTVPSVPLTRDASCWVIPAAAARPILANVPPRSGWTKRRTPPRRMSAV